MLPRTKFSRTNRKNIPCGDTCKSSSPKYELVLCQRRMVRLRRPQRCSRGNYLACRGLKFPGGPQLEGSFTQRSCLESQNHCHPAHSAIKAETQDVGTPEQLLRGRDTVLRLCFNRRMLRMTDGPKKRLSKCPGNWLQRGISRRNKQCNWLQRPPSSGKAYCNQWHSPFPPGAAHRNRLHYPFPRGKACCNRSQQLTSHEKAHCNQLQWAFLVFQAARASQASEF